MMSKPFGDLVSRVDLGVFQGRDSQFGAWLSVGGMNGE